MIKVSLLAAMTVDGFIGRDITDRSFDWTSVEDKQFYVQTIKRIGAVVMGSRSFQTFTKYPKGLEFVIYTSQPEKFVNPKPEVIKAWATKDTPQEVLAKLEKSGHQEVAICGGASIYTMFLEAGLVDRLYLTVEPVLFGSGVKLLSGKLEKRLKMEKVTQLSSQTILVEFTFLS